MRAGGLKVEETAEVVMKREFIAIKTRTLESTLDGDHTS